MSVIDPKIPAVKKYSDFDVIPAQAGIQVKAFKENGCQINTPGMTSLMKSGFFNSRLKREEEVPGGEKPFQGQDLPDRFQNISCGEWFCYHPGGPMPFNKGLCVVWVSQQNESLGLRLALPDCLKQFGRAHIRKIVVYENEIKEAEIVARFQATQLFDCFASGAGRPKIMFLFKKAGKIVTDKETLRH